EKPGSENRAGREREDRQRGGGDRFAVKLFAPGRLHHQAAFIWGFSFDAVRYRVCGPAICRSWRRMQAPNARRAAAAPRVDFLLPSPRVKDIDTAWSMIRKSASR